MIRPATRAQVEAGHRYSAFYRGHYANHLPMALVALDRMGADDAIIERFAHRYARAHLEPLDHGGVFARTVRDFHEDIARRGRDIALREAIGRLGAGAGSGAFHGAIRTAYALETDSDMEIAHALAYWSLVFEPIELTPTEGGGTSPQEALDTVRVAVGGKRPATHSIAGAMSIAAADPRFASWCGAFTAASDVEPIAPLLIDAYARTRDFALLHGVTGCHALRLLLHHAPDKAALVRGFWVAVVAAYAGAGAPGGDAATTPPASADWPAILDEAVHCDDEHDVKLAYSCWREWSHRGGELYRDVAFATAAAGAGRSTASAP